LKPDVCRRVVGRLPSPRILRRLAKAALVSTTRDGATTQLLTPLNRNPKKLEDRGGLTCEIARTYARIDFSRLARST